MPDLISHSLFADGALKSVNFTGREECEQFPRLYRLGAQGADLLYYADCVVSKKGLYQLADRFHEEATLSLPLKLLKDDGALTAMERAYLFGFLSHYCLDEAAHPLVYELQERVSKSRGCDSDTAHALIESAFESRELLEARGISPFRFNYKNDLPRGIAEREAAADAIIKLCGAADFTAPKKETLTLALSRFPLLYSILFDKSGILKVATTLIYSINKKDYMARWHLKRAYRESFLKSIFSENDYAEYRRRVAAALERFKGAVTSAGA